MKVIVGDETGLIKIVKIEDGSIHKMGQQTRKKEIIGMCWSGKESNFTSFSTGTKDGSLGSWDLENLRSTGEVGDILPSIPVALHFSPLNHKFCSLSENGLVKVFPEEAAQEEVREFQITGPITASCVANHLMASGGRANDVKLWDMGTQKLLWKAKNVPPDKLDLEVPIWPTALQFLDAEEGTCKLVSGTGYRHVRVYDTRTQRRPVHSWQPLQHRCTAVAATHQRNGVLVADGTGDIQELDLRTGKLKGRYPGPGGSVRDLAVHPSLEYFASVGLDRYLRIHKLGSRAPMKTIYLKQRLNKVLFSDDPLIESSEHANDQNQGEEDSDWDSYDEEIKSDEEEDDIEERDSNSNQPSSDSESTDTSDTNKEIDDYDMNDQGNTEKTIKPKKRQKTR